MRKIGNFQILGAAITTIGVMFVITNILAYLNVFQMVGGGFNTAIISLLMATNGYLIMLYGITSNQASTAVAAPVTY